MSRIGKKVLVVPDGVQVAINKNSVVAKGAKGQLSFDVPDSLSVQLENNSIFVTMREDSKHSRSMWGMSRTNLSNILDGVSKGFEQRLEIVGVGYRSAMQEKNLHLTLGFSHDVIYKAPEGITISVTKPTEIVVSGIDKQKVGVVAADIRSKRPPECYKGKGIRLASEFVVKKEGKKK